MDLDLLSTRQLIGLLVVVSLCLVTVAIGGCAGRDDWGPYKDQRFWHDQVSKSP